jgi:hypothetical protein
MGGGGSHSLGRGWCEWVGEFAINLMTQEANRSPVILTDIIQMVKEAFQLLKSMRPDNNGFIHIPDTADGPVGCPVGNHLHKLLYTEAGNQWIVMNPQTHHHSLCGNDQQKGGWRSQDSPKPSYLAT